jgi:hypothetical protein
MSSGHYFHEDSQLPKLLAVLAVVGLMFLLSQY